MMSKQKRISIIAAVTAITISFSVYVFKAVLPREDFRPVDMLTVGFTLLSVLKNIQLIASEVKRHVRK